MLKLLFIGACLWFGVIAVRHYWWTLLDVETPAPSALLRHFAMGLLIVMVTVTAIHFALQWQQDREVVTVQVVNANTGLVTLYQAQRGSVAGRQLRTVDGREIRMADVERMIILPTKTTD